MLLADKRSKISNLISPIQSTYRFQRSKALVGDLKWINADQGRPWQIKAEPGAVGYRVSGETGDSSQSGDSQNVVFG